MVAVAVARDRLAEVLDEVGPLRARPDDAHLPEQHGGFAGRCQGPAQHSLIELGVRLHHGLGGVALLGQPAGGDRGGLCKSGVREEPSQELDGTGAVIIHRLGSFDRDLTHPGAHLGRDER